MYDTAVSAFKQDIVSKAIYYLNQDGDILVVLRYIDEHRSTLEVTLLGSIFQMELGNISNDTYTELEGVRMSFPSSSHRHAFFIAAPPLSKRRAFVPGTTLEVSFLGSLFETELENISMTLI